jgi:phosphonate transport system permease protein
MKRRFSPGLCGSCIIHIAILTVAVIASFYYLSFNPFDLFGEVEWLQVRQFLGRFFPVDVSRSFLTKLGFATLETLAISLLATLFATFISLLLAPLAAGRFGQVIKQITRFFLNFLRSVPELVFAVIMVLAVGLGPFAGTLALMLHTTGVLGRLFGESIENHPTLSYQALIFSGASSPLAFVYGTLPGISSQLISYSLYRWEMNIRMATILGFVGAGGLGQILYYELSLLHEPQAASIMVVMLILVVIVDGLSHQLRIRKMS